jgi:hypothetical protein
MIVGSAIMPSVVPGTLGLTQSGTGALNRAAVLDTWQEALGLHPAGGFVDGSIRWGLTGRFDYR